VFLGALSAVLLSLGAAGLARTAQTPVEPEASRIERGRLLFEQRWTVAPSGLGRWGRGPTSNGEACTDCHAQLGRGSPPASPDEPLRQGVLRLSQRVGKLLLPHPAYGDQLQHQGVLGKVPGEGEVYVEWYESAITLADGTTVALRTPRVRLSGLSYGDLGRDSLLSLRLAPPLAGLGLLEQVNVASLERIAARQRGQGLSGRLGMLPGAHGEAPSIGRFGQKAAQPDLTAQIASALFMDLGVISPRFPSHDCPPLQWECAAHAGAGAPEIAADEIEDLAAYLRSLPAPASASAAALGSVGAALFLSAGCGGCHLPALDRDSGEPVHAYTDLLLHDLGPGLADNRPEGGAGGREWRTAPLWGMRAHIEGTAHAGLLHDGRARSVAEAILWHDGEARAARDAFARMSRPQRDALTAFVESL